MVSLWKIMLNSQQQLDLIFVGLIFVQYKIVYIITNAKEVKQRSGPPFTNMD